MIKSLWPLHFAWFSTWSVSYHSFTLIYVCVLVMRGWAKSHPNPQLHYPPAPIFLSDLITAHDPHPIITFRVRTDIRNPEKSWNFKTAISKPLSIYRKFWTSHGNLLFHNPLYHIIMFMSWISVRYWACIALLIPAAFNFKTREITAKNVFNVAYID